MKKFLLGLGLGLGLIAGITYATIPNITSITVATGISVAPVSPTVIHDVVLPPTTVDLGSQPAGTTLSKYFDITNNGNVTETINATVISNSANVTIIYSEFSSTGTQTVTIPAGGTARFDVNYTRNPIPTNNPNENIEIQVKFDVI
jgi:hypothetical protein